jgi:glycosyltransferase involved in cell wall biosynthesis
LRDAYAKLAPGDIVVVDTLGRTRRRNGFALNRETLGRELYKAGFECPLMWAGRAVLQAEARRASPLTWLLSTRALGAGPAELPGIDKPLVAGAVQIIAIARRGKLAPPAERRLKLSVVMPVYNERATFQQVMKELLAKEMDGVDIEICIVESNSTDGTREEVLTYANHPRVRLFLEDKPSGKGHAVRKGFELATGDIILIQDADLEYNLDDYEKLIDPIRNFEASFVLGSRHPGGNRHWKIRHFENQRSVSRMMNVGHIFFTWFLNVCFRQSLRDPFTMYKVFRRDCIHNIRFECNRFDFDHELVGKLVRNGFSPVEINVTYSSRSFDEGKKVSFFGDPPTWIMACVRHRFSQLHIWPQAKIPPIMLGKAELEPEKPL